MHRKDWSTVTAALTSRLLKLTDSNRSLQLELAEHDAVNRSLEIKGKKAEALLEESRRLRMQLQQVIRQILFAKETGRKNLSLRLQDEIVQTLEGIHLRLLVLSRGVSSGSEAFKKDIAITQDLVRQSLVAISSVYREHPTQNEN